MDEGPSTIQLAAELEQLKIILNNLLTNPGVQGLLHLQSYDSDPTKGNVGDLAFVGSRLKQCIAINTWVPVGGGLRVLFDHYANVGNSGTSETDLYSDSIAAAMLAANGDKLEAQYGGSFVSSGTATRQLRVYFAGSLIFDTGTLTVSLAAAWVCYVTIIRVSATVVRYFITLTTEGAALAAYTAVGEVTGLTLSSANILKITGQAAGAGAATNDIVAKASTVYFLAAAA